MIDQRMADTINDQINAEMFSAYLYQSMAAWFADQNFNGMAIWMTAQAQEEMIHAMKFYNYLIERGGTVLLKQIDGPPTEWASPLAAFEAALDHERYITERINKMMDLAIDIRDHAAKGLLQWYVDEQVEEEANATDNVEKLRMVGDEGNAKYMLDKEFGARPVLFTIPVSAAAE